jgi:23S rRNA pseudouridine2605 synthase
MEKGERIAKVMAASGLCSRREAERWIEAGRVKVDDKIITSPALNVNTATQKIEVDDTPLKEREKTRLWLYHKPLGLITSHKDPEGRGTVFEHLPKNMPRVVSVGRLDLNSEGLLLLTNNGDLAQKMMLPATGWIRRYRVRVYGQISDEQIAQLKKGVTIDDERFASIEVTREKETKSKNQWLTFSLKEGKNREIRRVCDFLGLDVNRLIRTAYGKFELGTLAESAVSEVSSGTVKKIMEEI